MPLPCWVDFGATSILLRRGLGGFWGYLYSVEWVLWLPVPHQGGGGWVLGLPLLGGFWGYLLAQAMEQKRLERLNL